jgi:rRNA maturation protein Nop10
MPMGIVDAVSGHGGRASPAKPARPQLEDRYPARRVAFLTG